MENELVLACSYMLMECPRCGLEQPKDRYCASCGLDVEKFLAKPKPFLVRLLQNPDFHLTLIGILLVIVVGYIFYVQRGLVSKRVEAFLPLLSRDSGDPNAPARSRPEPTEKADDNAVPETVAAEATVPETRNEAPAPAPATNEAQKVEVSYWEVPRDILTGLISSAEKLGENSGGRAYFWGHGTKAIESVEKNGRRITLPNLANAENGAKIQVETPATTAESFQFGLYFNISRAEGSKDATLKWESTMVLPPIETAAEAASRQPVVKALTETTLTGTSTLGMQNALLIVFEPSNRTPREEYIVKAGEGPWAVMGSEAFRAGVSDWVVLVQLKSDRAEK